MDKYDELVERTSLMYAVFMTHVERVKAMGYDHNDFNTVGVIFQSKTGKTWMKGNLHGRTVLEFSMAPGETTPTYTMRAI